MLTGTAGVKVNLCVFSTSSAHRTWSLWRWDTGLPLLQEAEREEPEFPLLQEGGPMKFSPAVPWSNKQLDLQSFRKGADGMWLFN